MAAVERKLIALAVLAALSITPPYLGPLVGLELDVSSSIEITSHAVPGVLAVVAALLALSLARRGLIDSMRAMAALGVCMLGGVYQTFSHIELVLHAGQPGAPTGTVVLHATPGPALLLLSLWLLLHTGKPAARA